MFLPISKTFTFRKWNYSGKTLVCCFEFDIWAEPSLLYMTDQATYLYHRNILLPEHMQMGQTPLMLVFLAGELNQLCDVTLTLLVSLCYLDNNSLR